MKIVSWNIQWCLGCDGRVDPGRIVDEARAFADFDVLCLQEVACNFPALKGSAGEDQFALLAERLPGFTALRGIAVDTPGPDGSRRLFGNMILSRLPVRQVTRVQLPWPCDPTLRNMPRMLLEAVLQAPFGLLRLMTTHLEYYSALQREAQVEGVRARHAEASEHARRDQAIDTSEGPFHSMQQTPSAVLTGDFNCRTSDPAYARMTAPFDERVSPLEDAWTALHPGVAQEPTVGVHDREQWAEPFACDFVFATRDLRPRLRAIAVDGKTQASDHQPVMLELG
jgi:endonuclease/exonuclease/phosphatase family metal-dependent hydrolase